VRLGKEVQALLWRVIRVAGDHDRRRDSRPALARAWCFEGALIHSLDLEDARELPRQLAWFAGH
jgi:hypothetical protein